MKPRSHSRRPEKGQADHVDAWLMSYADLITLLFMLFVVFLSISMPKHLLPTSPTQDISQHPTTSSHFGTLALGMPHDEAYRTLVGIVTSHNADRAIAIEKTDHGITIDLSAVQFFDQGTADIAGDQMSLLHEIARTLKQKMPKDYTIAVEGYTDDVPVHNNRASNNWELSALRAAHVVGLLIDQGVAPDRLRATGFASTHPLVPNSDEAGKPIAQNRDRNQRVLIRLEGPPGMAKEPVSIS